MSEDLQPREVKFEVITGAYSSPLLAADAWHALAETFFDEGLGEGFWAVPTVFYVGARDGGWKASGTAQGLLGLERSEDERPATDG